MAEGSFAKSDLDTLHTLKKFTVCIAAIEAGQERSCRFHYAGI
jgi:hypothetical protein